MQVALITMTILALVACAPTQQVAERTEAPVSFELVRSPVAPLYIGTYYCAKPEERTALNARAMQSELMVAALSCGLKKQYNQFVASYRYQLKGHGDVMKAYFRRVFGAEAKRETNRFVTHLANVASKQSLGTSLNKYCHDIETLFYYLEKERNVPREDAFANLHGIPYCEEQLVQLPNPPETESIALDVNN